ncbi:error-prone DNA polymerase [Shewanella loihica]|uniref:Error-prone DNA polymerase n=1 Tax=Shewanella loihica (strain ATCC BAA-1088 / PV-4) TaxID=323850 RepID=A3QER8_SHELP|nr:error-prone DNA polymerase [Shewanella loihica]ABO23966.1 DNA polymerase III, alpha subunit [Shewanella loihica PV-4]
MYAELQYAELHVLSNYSFLRGASHPHELVEQAKRLGYQALALTDECSFAGVVKAHEAAKRCDLKLILGAEFHLDEGLFVLLAPCRFAYGEISALITNARRSQGKGEYRVSLEAILAQQQSLLLWRPPSLAQFRQAGEARRDEARSDDARSDLAVNDTAESEMAGGDTAKGSAAQSDEPNLLSRYRDHIASIASRLVVAFPDRLHLLMERLLLPGEALNLQQWQWLSQTQKVPCVAAGGVRMHEAERQPLLDILTCIAHGRDLDSGVALCSINAEASLKPIAAQRKRYPQEWIDNGLALARRCHFSLDELKYEYPAEVVPAGMQASDYLAQAVREGARRRFPDGVPDRVKAQYEKELELIAAMAYEYFFLTIYDIVCFAKSQQILYQGRGSAANSVVCYCLGITEVDPTKINMLFERFISKERNEPPDIDVDFEHERREEVIQYIYRKYGRDRTALAAAVICYRFKSAMGDVGKALGIDAEQVALMIKNIDRRDPKHHWTTQLAAMLPEAGRGRMLLPLVQTLIGFPRHLSQHVGGFIISAGPLSELVPIENAAMADRTVIQWDKDDLESLGLLKVDILALGMLTAIRKTFTLLSLPEKAFSMADVAWEEAEVYRMLQAGDSIGVFQVESRAQSAMLPRLKPACYYDLVVQIAIVRPGPIQGDMVHPYLRRRDGLEAVEYPSPAVESVLSRTMGVPIFQEQVIQLAMVAAGFSGGEADQLRRAMASWKRTGELEKFEAKLLQGMAARGYSQTFAEQIYRQIKGFGEYGFPESHSASFALLAYVSAYLKHHYPAAFCCALLNSQPMGFYSPSQLIQDVQRHDVMVLPVCVNHSDWDNSLVPLLEAEQPAIRLGFRQVKGLRLEEIKTLIAARPEGGFTRVEQLYELGLSQGCLTLLASADALLTLAGHRYQARWQLSAYQPSLPLFDDLPAVASEVVLAPPSEMAAMQSDYRHLGLSLGRHVMAQLRGLAPFVGCRHASELADCRHGQLVHVAGVVVGRQRPGTASGVTFVTLEDETGNINVIVWSATARAQRQPFLTSKILKVTGVLETQSGVSHVIAGRLEDLSTLVNDFELSSRDFR